MEIPSNASKGLIRTFDLLTSLMDDVYKDFEYLESNKSSQHLRRNVVRSTFSFIEGIIQIIKFEINREIRKQEISANLSKSDIEILEEVKKVNFQKISWKIPLELNLRKTINIGYKVWDLKKDKYIFSKYEYKVFLMAKTTRNKLMHPKIYYDIEISDGQVGDIAATFLWTKSLFSNLMQERLNDILKDLPSYIVDKFRTLQIREKKSDNNL